MRCCMAAGNHDMVINGASLASFIDAFLNFFEMLCITGAPHATSPCHVAL